MAMATVRDQKETQPMASRPSSAEETWSEDGDARGNGDVTVVEPNVLLEESPVSDTEVTRSETSSQNIAKVIFEAAQDLDRKLSNEGEDILEQAGQLVSEAELKYFEAQSALESAEINRAEADAYFEKVIEKARQQVEQTLTIKTAAVTYRGKLSEAIETGSSTASTHISQGGKFLGMTPIPSKLSLKPSNKGKKPQAHGKKLKES